MLQYKCRSIMKTIKGLKNDGILKEHNFKVYQEIEALFEKENRVALVQATGTGKSFVAIQWLFDNCLLNGKKVLYLTAYNTIKDQFNKNQFCNERFGFTKIWLYLQRIGYNGARWFKRT